MKLIILAAVSFPLTLLGQAQISPDLIKTAEILAVSQNDVAGAKTFSELLKGEECEEEKQKGLNPQLPFLVLDETKGKSKWKFSVTSTLSGPKERLSKEFIERQNSPELNSHLDAIISSDFGSFEDRMKAVKSTCQGLSETDRISMASLLGGRLVEIFDHARNPGGPNDKAIVRSEDQWQALRTKSKAGVCRDSMMTVSQFLLACGFNKNQLIIKGYRTENTGHQVLSILTKDGEYTINWGELYLADNDEFKSPNVDDPGYVNTSLTYSLYDPETGKILEHKRTEFGEALKFITGGTTEDPTYTPQMFVAEAAYGGFAAKFFMTETERGGSAKGGAATFNAQKGDELSFISLATGVAYARNDQDVQMKNGSVEPLQQDIVFAQLEVSAQKAVPLFSAGKGKVFLTPNVRASVDGMAALNKLQGKKSITPDYVNELRGGVGLYFDSDPVKAFINGEASGSVRHKIYNARVEGKGYGGFYLSRYHLQAGASWEGNRLVASAESNYIIANLEKQKTLGVGLSDKKLSLSCEAIYSTYDNNYGTRENYLINRCSKGFNIQRLGSVSVNADARIPLEEDQKKLLNLGASLQFR